MAVAAAVVAATWLLWGGNDKPPTGDQLRRAIYDLENQQRVMAAELVRMQSNCLQLALLTSPESARWCTELATEQARSTAQDNQAAQKRIDELRHRLQSSGGVNAAR